MASGEKQKLIILTGPTAVGKSRLSLLLAKELQAEIISADSMQVYRQMNIGTDKLPEERREGVPHHLIDCLDPKEDFNVFLFRKMALETTEGITARGHLPLLVGGTGFYIQAVLYNIDFKEADEEAYRASLEEQVRQGGEEAKLSLHDRLREVDPVSAEAIHPNNVKRVIRALSFFELMQEPISEHNASERQKESPFDFKYFVLTDDRAVLYERINRRVEQMMKEGLLEEVRHLRDAGVPKDATSMQALGYRELYAYLDGEGTLEEAVEHIKRNTRHFAKRQLTWFRRERDVIWIDKRAFDRDDEKIAKEILRQCRE